jgi:hypothetical protein
MVLRGQELDWMNYDQFLMWKTTGETPTEDRAQCSGMRRIIDVDQATGLVRVHLKLSVYKNLFSGLGPCSRNACYLVHD